MDKCPKVGDRVRYEGGPVVGKCEGVVTAIYVEYTFDSERSDKWNALHGKPRPEHEWHVAMKPDKLPRKWCYPGNDKFAPEVSMLELL